jgi:hypothetical protein
MKPRFALVFSLAAIILGAVTDDLAQGLTVGDIHVDQPGLTVQAFLPCVFRTIAITHSGGRRSLIPEQGDRSFRAWRSPIPGNPIACSGQGDH